MKLEKYCNLRSRLYNIPDYNSQKPDDERAFPFFPEYKKEKTQFIQVGISQLKEEKLGFYSPSEALEAIFKIDFYEESPYDHEDNRFLRPFGVSFRSNKKALKAFLEMAFWHLPNNRAQNVTQDFLEALVIGGGYRYFNYHIFKWLLEDPNYGGISLFETSSENYRLLKKAIKGLEEPEMSWRFSDPLEKIDTSNFNTPSQLYLSKLICSIRDCDVGYVDKEKNAADCLLYAAKMNGNSSEFWCAYWDKFLEVISNRPILSKHMPFTDGSISSKFKQNLFPTL